uniref:Uncharacterized protein n=1 Tax=Ammonifex degensii TaxID=42838 RepID=A0A7C2EJ44_9THEO
MFIRRNAEVVLVPPASRGQLEAQPYLQPWCGAPVAGKTRYAVNTAHLVKSRYVNGAEKHRRLPSGVARVSLLSGR